jgi:hypothetical protein
MALPQLPQNTRVTVDAKLGLSCKDATTTATSISRRRRGDVLFHRAGNGDVLYRFQDVRAEGTAARLLAVCAVAYNLQSACQHGLHS